MGNFQDKTGKNQDKTGKKEVILHGEKGFLTLVWYYAQVGLTVTGMYFKISNVKIQGKF